ncbi:DUF3842 family protein [Holdemania massiliensis]|uniref:DUF3842 family protein n=1 Tax=Holdemania massiliensis TaxID=1468449 RepID=UPI001F062F5D|nr:DUF3842 family protein [Holdemania massiliensis]MCH1939743.1 DUF3842 family protein [Holdemania massiliensis]
MKEKTPLIVVIDGQGGMIGRKLCDRLLECNPELNLLALGTNSTATSTMLKGKARQGATGENPVLVAARRAAVIAGPASIVVADSMLGEITPKMAAGIGQSDAEKVLIPLNRCGILIAGVQDCSVDELIEKAVGLILETIAV